MCPVRAAQARGAATTDGYQLFHKELCTDPSQRQLCVEVCVNQCVLCFIESWKSAVCVCVHKQNRMGEEPGVTAAAVNHQSQAEGILSQTRRLEWSLRYAPGALSFYLNTWQPSVLSLQTLWIQLSPHRHYGSEMCQQKLSYINDISNFIIQKECCTVLVVHKLKLLVFYFCFDN